MFNVSAKELECKEGIKTFISSGIILHYQLVNFSNSCFQKLQHISQSSIIREPRVTATNTLPYEQKAFNVWVTLNKFCGF